MADRTPFTGRARNRRTRFAVRLADRLASSLISVGGIGTIVAVCGVAVYLVVMVLPLFGGAELSAPQPVGSGDRSSSGAPSLPHPQNVLAMGISDSRQIGWQIANDGRLIVFQPDTGAVLRSLPLLSGDESVAAVAVSPFANAVAIGLQNGSVRLGNLRFETSFLKPDEVDDDLTRLRSGQSRVRNETVVLRTGQGQYRRENVSLDLEGEPIAVSPGSAVRQLDLVETSNGPVLLAWSADATARLVTIGRSENVFTGDVELSAGSLTPLPAAGFPPGEPRFVRLGVRGTIGYLAWKDGTTIRFDTSDRNAPRRVQRLDLTDGSAELTALSFLVGRMTLLAGDSSGRVAAWFPARNSEPAEANRPTEPVLSPLEPSPPNEPGPLTTAEELALDPAAGDIADVVDAPLVVAHPLESGEAAVTTLAPAPRSRVAAAGFADGTLRVYQVTTESTLGSLTVPAGKQSAMPIRSIVLPPADEESRIYFLAGGGLYRAEFDAGHHEGNLHSFFQRVWYESYPESAHVWQTSSGTNAAEPKFGLVPLVFGTIKATFYSLLFAVPLALMAAIYTSEFLTKTTRGRVKPVIEIMASLPSVVLGFLAALVFAPWVRDWLPAVLSAAVTVPVTLLLSAHLWQLLPSNRRRRSEWMRLPLAGLAVIGGFLLAAVVAPGIESLFFAGDIERWLAGQIGSGFGAWVLLWLPISAFAVAIASTRYVNRLFVQASGNWSRAQAAVADLGRFAVLLAATVLLAMTISGLLTALGFDPRGSFVDTYVQRNALVVGFGMAFAIIPLIYTLADDALNAVPESLRSASLGAGATPWQTAVRVVMPTATSGLFSAVMVGLGRAVGETMIVLMAAGNTPVMRWNIFNGFETLSAAIATEMSEAVRGSTHFRTLFLAALVLFALTFLVNTVAELVRLRFRKRVVQL